MRLEAGGWRLEVGGEWGVGSGEWAVSAEGAKAAELFPGALWQSGFLGACDFCPEVKTRLRGLNSGVLSVASEGALGKARGADIRMGTKVG